MCRSNTIFYMQKYIMSIKINKSITGLKRDISTTADPIKKALLIEFLKLKVNETNKSANILSGIIKEQNMSIDKLKKVNAMSNECQNKAYNDLIAESTKITTPFDQNYAKYVENDKLNNKLAERLNSEIEFVTGPSEDKITKPFDDIDEHDITNIHEKI